MAKSRGAAAPDSRKILVVHDDPPARCALIGLLEMPRCQVIAADSGAKGLALLRNTDLGIYLLVTDCRLLFMGARELDLECSRMRIALRVLYLSDACACEQELEERTERGNAAVRPYRADQILRMAKDLLWDESDGIRSIDTSESILLPTPLRNPRPLP